MESKSLNSNYSNTVILNSYLIWNIIIEIGLKSFTSQHYLGLACLERLEGPDGPPLTAVMSMTFMVLDGLA